MNNHYKSLWLLLAAALLIITVISFVDDIFIGTIKVKKAPIAESLTKEYKTTEQKKAEKEVQLAKAKEKAKPLENPVDSTPQSFLIFGDSMSQNIALRLAAYARQNGHTIHTVNWDSSGTRIWSGCDTLDYYIREFKPTYIFISLGGNESGYPKPEVLKPNVEKIVKKIGNIPFVWIGPPSLKQDYGFSDMLLTSLPQGTFFRSDGLTLARRKDKIHPTVEAAAYQIDSLVRWMKTSAHPIKMDIPADSISNTKIPDTNITYLKPKH
ncbi:MAG: SGNH/GDSL hydrolase family protein [Muribaculaceae bacterium]|nr:SGNH/GDSL hydrolase family protein [Muribaculaceae bacterium]